MLCPSKPFIFQLHYVQQIYIRASRAKAEPIPWLLAKSEINKHPKEAGGGFCRMPAKSCGRCCNSALNPRLGPRQLPPLLRAILALGPPVQYSSRSEWSPEDLIHVPGPSAAPPHLHKHPRGLSKAKANANHYLAIVLSPLHSSVMMFRQPSCSG